ncbi:Stf0 family sulfotransferase [Phenylobacterium sp.]|uniref:Stf0 family sulfotransferase n=1 Tax=Phenylobacterium sp. TaxID=1871053 RepID=UPI00301D0C00
MRELLILPAVGVVALLGEIRDRLGERAHNPFYDRLPPGETVRRYLIATSGRTGSTLLCSRIGEYGRLGFPDEFLNEAYISQFDRLFPTPNLEDFEAYVSASFASEDGVFGLKTDWWRFQSARRLDLFRSFYEPLDLVVFLRREDFVAQAVSLTLAVETELWHERDVVVGDLEDRQRQIPFDADKVELHARNILNQEYYWTRFLEESPAPRVDLFYEDLARDVDAGVAAIARAFDIPPPPAAPSAPAVRKPRSEVPAEWAERFAAERADFVRYWRINRGELTASS